jgi:predicted DNA-binding ribbon-helix-helix protein
MLWPRRTARRAGPQLVAGVWRFDASARLLFHRFRRMKMCSVYVNADPIQYEARTRSIRINNVLTTIRLENLFWDVLAEIAAQEEKTTNQMIAALHGELSILRGDNPNFTSFLRVCCLRYLSLPRHEETAQKQAALRTAIAEVRPALPLHH